MYRLKCYILLTIVLSCFNISYASDNKSNLDLFISAGIGKEKLSNGAFTIKYSEAGFKFVQSFKNIYANAGIYTSGFTLNVPLGGGWYHSTKKTRLQFGADAVYSIDYLSSKGNKYFMVVPQVQYFFKLRSGNYFGVLTKASFPFPEATATISKYYSLGIILRL